MTKRRYKNDSFPLEEKKEIMKSVSPRQARQYITGFLNQVVFVAQDQPFKSFVEAKEKPIAFVDQLTDQQALDFFEFLKDVRFDKEASEIATFFQDLDQCTTVKCNLFSVEQETRIELYHGHLSKITYFPDNIEGFGIKFTSIFPHVQIVIEDSPLFFNNCTEREEVTLFSKLFSKFPILQIDGYFMKRNASLLLVRCQNGIPSKQEFHQLFDGYISPEVGNPAILALQWCPEYQISNFSGLFELLFNQLEFHYNQIIDEIDEEHLDQYQENLNLLMEDLNQHFPIINIRVVNFKFRGGGAYKALRTMLNCFYLYGPPDCVRDRERFFHLLNTNDFVFIPEEKRLRSLLLVGLSDNSILNTFLTQDLYDPRLLSLIVEFGREYMYRVEHEE